MYFNMHRTNQLKFILRNACQKLFSAAQCVSSVHVVMHFFYLFHSTLLGHLHVLVRYLTEIMTRRLCCRRQRKRIAVKDRQLQEIQRSVAFFEWLA